MKALTENTASSVLKEQVVPDHLFVYLLSGGIRVFDGAQTHTYQAGECALLRKNRLVKFTLLDTGEPFEPVLFCFDEPFLREFQQKHQTRAPRFKTTDAVTGIPRADLLDAFIRSLQPYHHGGMRIDEAFEALKYEELLIILLRLQPELSGLLFNFGLPGKIDLEAFMNRNYPFNISLSRFAFLTGRSLSAFKRDFSAVFQDTPGHWLMKKRLEEAYLLMDQQKQKPSEFYLQLGFESLSHFSASFKKQFGYPPSAIEKNK